MLCCAALDLPGVESSGRYIQHRWGSGKIPKRSAQRILKAVDQILMAGVFSPADPAARLALARPNLGLLAGESVSSRHA